MYKIKSMKKLIALSAFFIGGMYFASAQATETNSSAASTEQSATAVTPAVKAADMLPAAKCESSATKKSCCSSAGKTAAVMQTSGQAGNEQATATDPNCQTVGFGMSAAKPEVVPATEETPEE
jgi:hypothetical protein